MVTFLQENKGQSFYWKQPTFYCQTGRNVLPRAGAMLSTTKAIIFFPFLKVFKFMFSRRRPAIA
jgi:hypothetical protein